MFILVQDIDIVLKTQAIAACDINKYDQNKREVTREANRKLYGVKLNVFIVSVRHLVLLSWRFDAIATAIIFMRLFNGNKNACLTWNVSMFAHATYSV